MKPWCDFVIATMYCADQERIPKSDLPAAILGLQTAGRWHGVQIYPDAQPSLDGHWQFPRLSLGWDGNGGSYLVHCEERADSGMALLVSSQSFSEPAVYVETGARSQELWPNELFVSYDLAVLASNHFLLTGLQHPSLGWVELEGFPRLSTGHRQRGR